MTHDHLKTFIDSEAGNGRLKAERALLATALEDVQAMAATLTGFLMGAQEQPTELYKVGLGSVRFLMSVGDLVMGWLLLQTKDNGSELVGLKRELAVRVQTRVAMNMLWPPKCQS